MIHMIDILLLLLKFKFYMKLRRENEPAYAVYKITLDVRWNEIKDFMFFLFLFHNKTIAIKKRRGKESM